MSLDPPRGVGGSGSSVPGGWNVDLEFPAPYGGTIADGCEKVSRPQPKKNPAGITLEIRFIDVGSKANGRRFRFFDFLFDLSYFTRPLRVFFDFLSNPGLWLLRK